MKKFWNWKSRKIRDQDSGEERTERVLFLNGTIAEESWYDDEVTPALFKEELMAGSGHPGMDQQPRRGLRGRGTDLQHADGL